MQKITNECKEGDVRLCEHATSHMRILVCNICNICLTKANAVLHPRLVLHYDVKTHWGGTKMAHCESPVLVHYE
jgi:hypothetical protein